MITLDEAIGYVREAVALQRMCNDGHQCAAEHEQLACWLEELAVRRAGSDIVDRLKQVWDDQVAFMTLLRLRRGFPEFPVDLTSKAGQRLVKEIAQDAAGEVFEALAHLKNSKLHRATDVPEFDRSAYVEELVDALKLLVEVAILSGVTLSELWTAYEVKTAKNTQRIESDY